MPTSNFGDPDNQHRLVTYYLPALALIAVALPALYAVVALFACNNGMYFFEWLLFLLLAIYLLHGQVIQDQQLLQLLGKVINIGLPTLVILGGLLLKNGDIMLHGFICLVMCALAWVPGLIVLESAGAAIRHLANPGDPPTVSPPPSRMLTVLVMIFGSLVFVQAEVLITTGDKAPSPLPFAIPFYLVIWCLLSLAKLVQKAYETPRQPISLSDNFVWRWVMAMLAMLAICALLAFLLPKHPLQKLLARNDDNAPPPPRPPTEYMPRLHPVNQAPPNPSNFPPREPPRYARPQQQPNNMPTPPSQMPNAPWGNTIRPGNGQVPDNSPPNTSGAPGNGQGAPPSSGQQPSPGSSSQGTGGNAAKSTSGNGNNGTAGAGQGGTAGGGGGQSSPSAGSGAGVGTSGGHGSGAGAGTGAGAGAGAGGAGSGAGQGKGKGSGGMPARHNYWLLLLLLLLVLLVALYFLWKRYWRPKKYGGGDALPPGSGILLGWRERELRKIMQANDPFADPFQSSADRTPQSLIRRAYQTFLAFLHLAGYERQPAQTEYNLAEWVEANTPLNARAVWTITRICASAQYAPTPQSVDELEPLQAALQVFMRDVEQRVPPEELTRKKTAYRRQLAEEELAAWRAPKNEVYPTAEGKL